MNNKAFTFMYWGCHVSCLGNIIFAMLAPEMLAKIYNLGFAILFQLCAIELAIYSRRN